MDKKSVSKEAETHQTSGAENVGLTTAQGVPIADNQNSLRIGEHGPTLLEDFHLREKIFHFDHERIPERVVHARGFGAHGFFENYQSLSHYTKADLFQRKKEKTPVFVRFSTVVGNKGSPDLARDVRGFAVKFYTKHGNWDIVGNNIPVFFIQDAIKFPDLIHAAKDEPDSGFPQAQTAHDNFWDFISLNPESMHMVMWIMSDRTIPRSFRFMEGFGVHTFRFINSQDKSIFVKFHWKPKLGLQSVTWDEAVILNGADPDFHRRDLWYAIKSGNFPEWELGLQIFDEIWAEKFEFDVLDATKLIPEEILPIEKVGRLVLNRCVDNFFAETEQVAFCTQNIIPGIDFSNDPLLQGRNFSYLDTQLKRLGSPNFTQLPINAPKCPLHVFHQDGHMAFSNISGRANYEPNSWGKAGGPRESPKEGFKSYKAEEAGKKLRLRPESFSDYYTQARLFYVSQIEVEQQHIANALVFELSKVVTSAIQKKVVMHLFNIDLKLATQVAERLGLEEMTFKATKTMTLKKKNLKPCPSLSIVSNANYSFEGRKLGIVVGENANYQLINHLKSLIKKEKASLEIISEKIAGVRTGNGVHLKAQQTIVTANAAFYDAIAIILGDKESIHADCRMKLFQFIQAGFLSLKFMAYSQSALSFFEQMNFKKNLDKGCIALFNLKDCSQFLMDCKKLRFWKRKCTMELI